MGYNMKQVLFWISGSSSEILQDCGSTEEKKYIAVGLSVFIPATIVLLLQGKIGASIAYFIYNATYSIIIEYFIKPKLIGKGMKMNTIFVFIGILGGLKLWGILGIIYGPFIITIIFTLFEIYRLEYRPAHI